MAATLFAAQDAIVGPKDLILSQLLKTIID
jgi:hypothetical protein